MFTRRTLLAQTGCTAAFALSACAPGIATAPTPPPARTPSFFVAIRNGDTAAIAAALAEDPALLHARDERQRSGFSVALVSGQSEAAALLREKGYALDLAESAWVGDWERFSALASATPERINASHPLGGSAMWAAASGGRGTEMWRVYEQGGLPNPVRPTAEHTTPLRAAMELPDLEQAELSAAYLLANGADPNAPEPGGRSTLHVAAARGSQPLVEMLIRKGARPNAHDADGRAPHWYATEEGHDSSTATLASEASIARDSTAFRLGFTADGQAYHRPALDDVPRARQIAFVSAAHHDFEATRASLEAEPQLIHSLATTNELAVEAASHRGGLPIAELLLEYGAPLTLPTAALSDDVARVERMLDAHPERVHERGPHDFAPLWYPVIGGGCIEMTKLLIERGADIEAQHSLGTTALHFAAIAGKVDMVSFLLSRGAQWDRVGRKFGGVAQTPRQLAEERGHREVVARLDEHGARTR